MFPRLTFSMDIPNHSTSAFQYGKLLLNDDDENVAFMATSGIANYQYHGGWKIPRRGLIPPRSYEVSTNKLWLPNVRGIEGSFFAISPFMVDIDGVKRGDFGIHFDPPGTLGSAGCIVLKQQDHWTLFLKKMAEYQALRIKSIPLKVVYS